MEKDVGSCSEGRALLDQLLDKWTMLVLKTLWHGPLRFNALKHRLDGVTQKTLTQCLRRLERNGMVERTVIPVSPVAVEYRITELGRSLGKLFASVYTWTQDHRVEIGAARQAYDARNGQAEPA
ncbi:helix-turn-helix domain-containing protein [uncultured Massilia sp.]|uniref:winged helix-turn-helix transcriptional regulator n=1 Tax=uncultured Massilia sp. TaxID=169973 RepID=UPI00260059B8|nr:helix-turn-helix domain-containing protein [uncultured Massilia sp.]